MINAKHGKSAPEERKVCTSSSLHGKKEQKIEDHGSPVCHGRTWISASGTHPMPQALAISVTKSRRRRPTRPPTTIKHEYISLPENVFHIL
jgi:hypothetical protein